ncbi:MAG: leucine--tRNA ligase, partial [Deltaproteobacteria bacterium]|nr:leucine--tRNA ligase [Deltaproteobacteria bacterium]
SSPDYYRWEQWIFTKMYAAGLAFRKNANVNWCDRCRTVLANEQAEGGVCWRCDGPVVLRAMEQWFLRFPDYAEALLRDLEQLTGWPERVRVMQREWIGRSEGALIRFPLEPLKTGGATVTDAIEIFTTRPDTLFGVTFMSLAWEHPLVDTLTRGTPHEAKVSEFVRKAAAVNHEARLSGNYEKAGVFTGAYCRHPITDANIPIYVANFVVMGYGTGAVMAVPAHDQRDFEFARAYRLPIRVVIQPEGDLLDPATMTAAHEGEGRMIASGQFDGLASDEGKTAIVKQLESKGLGHKTVTYKLKDWCVSRQRYWGAPIPIVYCDACGTIPVPEANLPVVLPTDVPLTGEGGSPLAKLESFVKTTCPRCGKGARRETDTMDTFVESSWYFLRYCSPSAAGGPADSGEVNYWMPIDHYIGGIEHAVGHLCAIWGSSSSARRTSLPSDCLRRVWSLRTGRR